MHIDFCRRFLDLKKIHDSFEMVLCHLAQDFRKGIGRIEKITNELQLEVIDHESDLAIEEKKFYVSLNETKFLKFC